MVSQLPRARGSLINTLDGTESDMKVDFAEGGKPENLEKN